MDSVERYLYSSSNPFFGGNVCKPKTREVRQLFMGTILCTALLPLPNKYTPAHCNAPTTQEVHTHPLNARPYIDQCYTATLISQQTDYKPHATTLSTDKLIISRALDSRQKETKVICFRHICATGKEEGY
jgi:hypothetical protein